MKRYRFKAGWGLILSVLLLPSCASGPARGENPGSSAPSSTVWTAQASTTAAAQTPSAAPAARPSAAAVSRSAAKTSPPPASGGTAAGQAAPAAALAAPSISGRLRVNGSQLTDSRGAPVQLRGVSTHGIAWFPSYINERCFRQLRREWQVNAVRLAMYTQEYGGYCAGGDREQLKAWIHQGVTAAAAQDMYVIIDWHILSDGNPRQHEKEAAAFFAGISAKYAGYSHVLYEICNEPNGAASWSDVKAYAESIIRVIRANDKDAVILVGTPHWSQAIDQAAADPLTGYDNLMYTLHFYAATHKEALRGAMIAAVKGGLPVFVSEYGLCDASGNGAIDEPQAAQWIQAMDRYGVSYIAWNLSNKAETSAILRSSCRKTYDFEEADLSDSGLWLYRMLTGKKEAVPSLSAPPSSMRKEPSQTSESRRTVSGNAEAALAWTAELQNSWESGGQTFFQYGLTIRNTSGAAFSEWAIALPFSGPVTLENGWNGRYTADGATLRIASAAYNGDIPPGGVLDTVGFIVKGDAALALRPGS